MNAFKGKRWIVDKSVDNLERDPAILEAADLLKAGEVIAFPTETVYGLGGNARSDCAIQKIFSAKGRPGDNPLIIHIASLEQLSKLAVPVSETAHNLIKAFWPGPLTIVFPKAEGISRYATAGLDTVAIRMPAHPVALALIRAAGLPIAAPSANRSGKPSPTSAEHVAKDLDGKIAGIVDGGETGIGVESTVVECRADAVTVLRPGGITTAQLKAVVPIVDEEAASSKKEQAPKSPGMKYTHYAPNAPLILVSCGTCDMQTLIDEQKEKGKRVGVLTTEEKINRYAADVVLACGKREDLSTVAAALYRTLRCFDEHDVDVIFSESFPRKGIGDAIMNRLEKAAGGRSV